MSNDQKKTGRPSKGTAALTVPVAFKTSERGARVLDALVEHCRTQPGFDETLTQADLLRTLVRDRYRDAVKYERMAEVE